LEEGKESTGEIKTEVVVMA